MFNKIKSMFKGNTQNKKKEIGGRKTNLIDSEEQLGDKHYEFLKRVDKHNVNMEFGGLVTLLGLNAKETIKFFIDLELIKESDYKDEIQIMTIPKLKDILRSKQCKLTGKKQELVERVLENFSREECSNFIKGNKYYILTEKGKELLGEYRSKKEKELLEVEYKCIQLLKQRKINESYKEMALYESKQPLKRGMGIDWDREYRTGLNKIELMLLNELYKECDIEVVCAVAMISFWGGKNIKGIILRNFNNLTHEEVDLIEEKAFYLFKVNNTKRELLELKEAGIEKYEFLASLDSTTCSICGKLDGKAFRLEEAVIGVNCPPMHNSCRCCTVAYFKKEKGDTRIARNPETGKNYYVPSNMNYSKWIKTVNIDVKK